MKADLFPTGNRIPRADTQAALQPKQRRQGAWNQQRIGKPVMEKRDCDVRLYHPAIQRVQGAAGDEERVAEVPKGPHSRTRMMSPKPSARTSFTSKIMGIT